jgi:hypothetical protein
LDTASVESAAPVQEVLQHRLADMDLVIFLDSPTAPSSPWIIDELSTAEHLGLAVLQLVWPTKPSPFQTAGLSRSHHLKLQDFVGRQTGAAGTLTPKTMADLIALAEKERIESLGFRRRRVISEFLQQASNEPDVEIVVHPVGPMEVLLLPSRSVVAWAVPFVGRPDGWNINREHAGLRALWESFKYDLDQFLPAEQLKRERLEFKLPTRIVYDSLGVQSSWLEHLGWLSAFLPAKVLRIDRAAGEAESPVRAWIRDVQAGGGR